MKENTIEDEAISIENKYPVSKERCSRCVACCLVYKTITGAYIEEKHQYYQCISDMDVECRERAEERKQEEYEYAEHEREQEELEEKERQAFMREQNYTCNSMYGLEY